TAPPPSPLTRPGAAAQSAGALLGAGKVDAVAVGCSTGGPDALAHVLAGLSGDLPVPMVVVQHMPPLFTQMFAERLNRSCPLEVVEAAPDMVLRAGTVYIAPGDRHLEVVRRGTDVVTRLTSDPPENSCRPAADVLFRSVARVYGRATLAVVLTGMGQDGLRGCEPLRAAGGRIVVQDEATSVVWGMPGAVAGAGLADAVLPLAEIAPVVAAQVNAGRLPRRPVVTR
ncbi:MAG TPA: CheB methylesterase domain-containing protein, partial [Pilimelia sp.]|nr:CheB methylesterase domain-containing protein [Pilimelia sp.]